MPAYVDWRAVRYDNPLPTRFLAPIDCLKIPAQVSRSLINIRPWFGKVSSLDSRYFPKSFESRYRRLRKPSTKTWILRHFYFTKKSGYLNLNLLFYAQVLYEDIALIQSMQW